MRREYKAVNIAKQMENLLGFKDISDDPLAFETFYPWELTVENWLQEGLPLEFAPGNLYPVPMDPCRFYFNDCMTVPVARYEEWLGFSPLRRLMFSIPYFSSQYRISGWDDWKVLKEKTEKDLERYCTHENMMRIYGPYAEEHEKGKYTIRLRAGTGFFWLSRELLGIEEQFFAFYDDPELIHDINRFQLKIYKKYLTEIAEILKPEVLLIPEDLSGVNGPMISPAVFREFVGNYYRQLFPELKEHGVKNIFIDTDGDFRLLIPDFLECGVDGFIPMDVNAGMDIAAVRRQYPGLKFIGAFNKLKIVEGPEAIDREFERILPVVRQGGYIPGCDHQAAPSASLKNYQYYIKRLWEVMREAGTQNA